MLSRIHNLFLWLREVQSESGKKIYFILQDFLFLKKKEKLSRVEYSNYRMYSQSVDFRNSFLPYAQAEYFWKILNPRRYACLARDKYLSHCLLKNAGIPSAELYIYYNPDMGAATDILAYNYETVRNILEDKKLKQLVVKPASDSAHGAGVFICKEIQFVGNDCFLIKQNDEIVSLKSILGKTPLLFESLVTQTKQISLLNSSSVNTVRIMTALYPQNEVKIVAAFIKIGRLGSDVDNAGGGGNVDCAVDLESGRLYNCLEFNSWKDIKNISYHPDSQELLEGTVLTGWNNIISQVKEFQAKIPFLKTIGWDVAITDNGPVIIEINNWWDTTGQLFIGKGWKVQIKQCYEAWVSFMNEKQ